MDFLVANEFLGKPVWMWAGFLAIVVALLVFDLGVLHKENKEIEVAESLKLSGFYFALAMAFGGIAVGLLAGLCWSHRLMRSSRTDS